MTSIDELSEDSAYFDGLAKSDRTPDAVDLLALQQRILHLSKRELELEGKSRLLPGTSRELEGVRTELRQLYVLEVSVKEHVWAHSEQAKIYDNQKRLRTEAAQRARDEDRTAPSTDPQKRSSLREYIDRVKKERESSSDKARGRDDEREP